MSPSFTSGIYKHTVLQLLPGLTAIKFNFDALRTSAGGVNPLKDTPCCAIVGSTKDSLLSSLGRQINCGAFGERCPSHVLENKSRGLLNIVELCSQV